MNVTAALETIAELVTLRQQLTRDKEAGLASMKVNLLLQYATYLISMAWPDQRGLRGMGLETRNVSRESMWNATLDSIFGKATQLLKSKLSEDHELLAKIAPGLVLTSPS